MFTEKAQAIIDLGKDCAFAQSKEMFDLQSLLAAVGSDAEAGVRLAECLTDGNAPLLRAKCPELVVPAPCPGELLLTQSLKEVIISAQNLASAEGVPDHSHPGLIDLRHLICALALSREVCRILEGCTPISSEKAIRILIEWYESAGLAPSVADLVNKLRGLRTELLSLVFGQDHAIHTFIEGLYNAELTAATDKERKRPAAIFVFVGPPGVGKTFMSELCAAYLKRPFKRFDMTGFTDHQAHNQLVGFAESYKGAQEGQLTGFVRKNPAAILLFDEIEKAHLTTIQLFYQILDAGRLEDKFTNHDVRFRDSIIIFTSNAGKSLYDNPNKMGISAANSNYHKRTILSALRDEKNPTTGQPAFPQPICSRLAQGYPVMFNHLGINELERVSNAEMVRNEGLLERQYFKHISHNAMLPLFLVLREGGTVDARQLKSEAEKFVKGELFKYCSLYTQDKLENVFEGIDRIHFEIEGSDKKLDREIQALFDPLDKPKVLLAAGHEFAALCQKHITEIEWISATSVSEIIEILTTQDIDMVLLDIWVRREISKEEEKERPEQPQGFKTVEGFDFVPLTARALDDGREILRNIHNRVPQTPVYLLSFAERKSDNETGGSQLFRTITSIDGFLEDDTEVALPTASSRPVDDELFLACVRSGGARGLLTTTFSGNSGRNRKSDREQFAESLIQINRRLYREKKAGSLSKERKVLAFDTSADLDQHNRQLTIRLRNFSLVRAVDSMDAGELVNDIERPTTRFDDVIGAKSAKESLQFVIDWLKNPKRFAAMGIRQPKGILLAGPPGTGKTMLARAVAGESNCAFIEKSASVFVTKWQGSGPQNVRDLFERARRYAPAVIFLDEVDAIGIRRTGGAGGSRAQEETLNAMLTEMDGFRSQSQNPVIVLAATNLADRLDEALKRRFDRTIVVDKPDKAARLIYLEKVILQRKNLAISKTAVERLAGQTSGMTIADLERIVHEAAVMAAQNNIALTDKILNEAFEKTRMGEAKETVDKSVRKRVARHEAGHAFIAWSGGVPLVQLTIVGRGGAGGFMEQESDEGRILATKSELEQRICVTMGGRAAEIFYYGEEEGLSTGVGSDLQSATDLATEMVISYGMSEGFGQVSLRGSFYQKLSEGLLAEKISELSGKIVKQQLDRGVQILKDNRSALDRLVAELLEKDTLYREDLETILPLSNLNN